MRLRPSRQDLAGLKTPLGLLLAGSAEEAVPKLRFLIERDRPPMIHHGGGCCFQGGVEGRASD